MPLRALVLFAVLGLAASCPRADQGPAVNDGGPTSMDGGGPPDGGPGEDGDLSEVLLEVEVNMGAGLEVVPVYRGWPLVLEGIIAGPAGTVGRAERLMVTVVDGAGQAVAWGLERHPAAEALEAVSLERETRTIAFTASKDQTASLPAGRYRLWASVGTRRSPRVTLEVMEPPSTGGADVQDRRALLEARQARLQGRMADAVTVLNTAVASNPSMWLWLELARLHRDLGSRAEALGAADRAEALWVAEGNSPPLLPAEELRLELSGDGGVE